MRRNMVQQMVFTQAWEEGGDCGGKAEGPMSKTFLTV